MLQEAVKAKFSKLFCMTFVKQMHVRKVGISACFSSGYVYEILVFGV